jgi:hypothetical protein
MAIWLTDGRKWLGPYSDQEPFAIRRGVRALTAEDGAVEVWRIRADTRDGARKRLTAHLAEERAAERSASNPSGCIAGL